MTDTLQPTINPAQQITITVGGSTPAVEVKEDDKSKKVSNKKEDPAMSEDSTPADKKDLIPQIPYQSDPLFFEVANYFGLKQEDYDSAKNKLSDIVEYVIREIDSNKVEDIIPVIRKIEDSIQSSSWDERRYANFHKYIRLADKKSTITKMMKAYEKVK